MSLVSLYLVQLPYLYAIFAEEAVLHFPLKRMRTFWIETGYRRVSQDYREYELFFLDKFDQQYGLYDFIHPVTE